MFSYIKRHWPIYLILVLIAIALGFGAAYVVGVKGSTPESTISVKCSTSKTWVPTVFLTLISRLPVKALLLRNRNGVLNSGMRASRYIGSPAFLRTRSNVS